MTKISKFAEAIKTHEGFYPGSRSFRNNNPGNLKYAAQAKATGRDAAGFAIFASYVDGWEALRNQIMLCINGKSRIYFPTMTITQFFQSYAPSSDNNNPLQYAQAVAAEVGITVDSTMGSLSVENPPAAPADVTPPALPAIQHLKLVINDQILYERDI